MERTVLLAFLLGKLREPGTYVTAIVVGTLINAYGHFLVPYLRGHDHLVQMFLEEFAADPWLVGFSVALGYIFPFLVGTYASVATRWSRRHVESRALFPDAKPDPVFRADAEGTIVELGEGTRVLFDAYQVRRAQDILGEQTWQRLVQATREGASLESSARIWFEPEKTWYLVGHSPAPRGTVNVYLTRVPAGFGADAT